MKKIRFWLKGWRLDVVLLLITSLFSLISWFCVRHNFPWGFLLALVIAMLSYAGILANHMPEEEKAWREHHEFRAWKKRQS